MDALKRLQMCIIIEYVCSVGEDIRHTSMRVTKCRVKNKETHTQGERMVVRTIKKISQRL